MRDLHMEAMVRQYGRDGELEDCEVVQVYRQSGRSLHSKLEQEKCSLEESTRAQMELQRCSLSASTSVYSKIENHVNLQQIKIRLCEALSTIRTVCVRHLDSCFVKDDIRQMKETHLQEMTSFLRSIFREKIDDDVLDDCEKNDMQKIETAIEYSYDDDEFYTYLDDGDVLISNALNDTERGLLNTEHDISDKEENTTDKSSPSTFSLFSSFKDGAMSTYDTTPTRYENDEENAITVTMKTMSTTIEYTTAATDITSGVFKDSYKSSSDGLDIGFTETVSFILYEDDVNDKKVQGYVEKAGNGKYCVDAPEGLVILLSILSYKLMF